MPASSNASLAAATAYCENSSILFAALKSMRSFATKSFTSAAICTLNSDASNFVIGPMPTLPSLIPAQNSSTVFPIGVTAPSPVTTTLLFISIKTLSFPKHPTKSLRPFHSNPNSPGLPLFNIEESPFIHLPFSMLGREQRNLPNPFSSRKIEFPFGTAQTVPAEIFSPKVETPTCLARFRSASSRCGHSPNILRKKCPFAGKPA